MGAGAALRLLEAGTRVRAAVRNVARAAALAGLGAEVVEADLDRPETLPAAVAGMDGVLLSTPVDPRIGELHARLYSAAKEAGVRHIVRISVVGAAEESPLVMGRYHVKGDRALQESDMGWTILRPQAFAQNFFAAAASIRAEGRLYGCAGQGLVPHIDARDISAAAAAVLLQPGGHAGRIYDLTGPAAISMNDIAAAFSRALGKTVTYVKVPSQAMLEGMTAAGLPEWLAAGLVWLYENAYADGCAAPVSGAVQRLTGRPATTFEQFVRDHAAAFSS